MTDIMIPAAFTQGVVAERGDAAFAWLESLPTKIDQFCSRWKLTVDGAPMHGYIALVLPVVRGDEKCVLKISWVDSETQFEPTALRAWNGEGAVRLLDADEELGALLLERLDSETSLATVDIDEAVATAAKLLRKLAIAAPKNLPTLHDYGVRHAKMLHSRWDAIGRPCAKRTIDFAMMIGAERASNTNELLVDWDLHYDNVLAGGREPWLVIDPKVMIGDAEFGLPPLMWNRFDSFSLDKRFNAIVENARLDRRLALDWLLVRVVDYWLWAVEAGLTDDPRKCERIVEWLSTKVSATAG